MKQLLDQWKQKTYSLKIQIYALLLAYREPRTPWFARVFSALVAGYAFSPIALIPDFVLILDFLDDLILLPLGVIITLRLVSTEVMKECQEKAHEQSQIVVISYWCGFL